MKDKILEKKYIKNDITVKAYTPEMIHDERIKKDVEIKEKLVRIVSELTL